MRKKRFACQLAILFLSLLVYSPVQSYAADAELTSAQRKSLVCGPNATLLLLTMCGLAVSEAEIAKLHSNERGASLAEMQAFCRAAGLETEVLRFEIDDASHVRLPAIVHSDTGETDHYYVWYDVTEHFVLALDSTTGEKLSFRREKLDEFWTGYTLVPSRFARGQLWLSAAANDSLENYAWGLGVLSAIAVGVRYWRTRGNRTAAKTAGYRSLVAAQTMLGCLVLATSLTGSVHAIQGDRSGVSYSGATELPEGTQWRDAEHGGQNCLYVFLRLITGKQLDYASLTDSDGLPPQSLVQLGTIASRYTTRAAIRQLKPADLTDLEVPALVHLNGDDAVHGCFVLLLQQQGQNLVFMNGPSATISAMTREDFLRRWSGYCLVRLESSNRFWVPYVLGSISALLVVLSISFKGRTIHE